MALDVIAEVEPPAGNGPSRLLAQVSALAPVASRFLVPDNHLGRPTVSSLVVAAGIDTRPVTACLNARDRNLLGLRRDLLTAQHLGIDELLLLRGDDPTVGERAGGIGVRDLVSECEDAGIAYGVTGGSGPLPEWKRGATRVILQVGWSADDLERRLEALQCDQPVFAGVLVLPSAAAARRIGDRVPELRPPATLVDALERDPFAGMHAAVDLLAELDARGSIAGVHLIAGVRSAEIAARLGSRIPTIARSSLRRTA